nr:MAG TPA: hypothetical protein [Caudoviricetes sp.]
MFKILVLISLSLISYYYNANINIKYYICKSSIAL